MTTAADILNRAGRAIGYLGQTEVMTAADINAALAIFNSMLDSWSSSESLIAYLQVQQNFPLVIGQQTYTIGSGGNWNTTRPQEILRAFVRDSNNLDYSMGEGLTQDEWDSIGQKNITSQIPTSFFYYPSYPLAQFNVFPIPLLNYTVYFDSTLDQVTYTTLTTSLSMPLGYERAYISNLALELMANGFPCLLNQQQLSALVASASEAKGNVKRSNIKVVRAKYDDAIVSKSYATYNIYSDGNPRN